MQTTPDLGIPELAQAQQNPDVTHNEAVVLIQALLNGAIDKDLTAPPGAPTEGDTYIIDTAAPTGAWAGHARAIAIYWSGSWRFVPGFDDAGTPIVMGARQEGISIWVRDEDVRYTWTGAAWSSLSGLPATAIGFTPYDDNSATNVQTAIQQTMDKRVKKTGGDIASGALRGLSITQTTSGTTQTDSALIVVSTDPGATGPSITRYHNSASPAVTDVIRDRFFFNNNLGTPFVGGLMTNVTTNVTSGAESTEYLFGTIQAGTFLTRLRIGAGAYMNATGGGDMGVTTFNAARLYRNGIALNSAAAVATDADFTLIVGTNQNHIQHTGPLTANRTATLSTTGVVDGDEFSITRTGAGAFNLSVGGLKNLATNTWCRVKVVGGVWVLMAYGAL